MKHFSLVSIAFIFLLIATTGCNKEENSENGNIDPPSPSPSKMEYVTGEFILKQNGIEVQKKEAKLWTQLYDIRLGNTTRVWYFDALSDNKADFFPMKIDSVVVSNREGKWIFTTKDQIPEVNSEPNSEYKITSFTANFLGSYLIVEMNMGEYSVYFKGKQER